MIYGIGSVRDAGGLGRVDRALRTFEDEARTGRPDLVRLWREHGGDGSHSILAALVKADLAARFGRGESPEVLEYLDRFPTLRGEAERVLSLVYEEFCLREDLGEHPDPEAFCERYAPWKDSLASQLRYHRVISRVVGVAPPAPRFPVPGEKFEQFLIDSELGRGGAARVYLARDEKLGFRAVALKVSPDRGNEPSILGKLEHPHIVSVLSLASQAETNLRGLCMPYRPGIPLDRMISRLKPGDRPSGANAIRAVVSSSRIESTPDHARGTDVEASDSPGWAAFPDGGSYADGVAWVIATLAEALAYAHDKEIVHRDVKPANVLMTLQGGPQLLDFNLSHDPHSPEQAEAALRGGTLPYMAPEQLKAFLDPTGWDRVTGASDIYSLGLVMREFLTGEAPEVPESSLPLPRAIQALLDRRAEWVVDLRRTHPGMPLALESIVSKCLEFAPERRYAAANELAADLRRFLARRPLKFAPNRSTRELVVNWCSRSRRSLAFLALGLAIFSAWEFMPRSTMPPLEQRPVFCKVVEAHQSDRNEELLKLLVPLSWEARQSPVASLYLAIAHARGKSNTEAKTWIENALQLKTAEGSISKALHENAQLAGSTASLIGILLNEDHEHPSPSRDRFLTGLERLAGWLVKYGSKSEIAWQELAVIAERLGNYAEAHERLRWVPNAVQVGTERSPAAMKIGSSLQTRARIATTWAKWTAPLVTRPDDLQACAALLDGAITDLKLTRTLMDPKHIRAPEHRYAMDFVRCDAIVELGDVEAKLGRVQEADKLYNEAEALLDALKDLNVEKGEHFRSLSERVQSRNVSRRPEADASSWLTIQQDRSK